MLIPLQYLVVTPTTAQPVVDIPPTVERRSGENRRADDVKIDKMMDEISELRQFLQNPANVQLAPANYEDTNLDDDEIDDIMSTLLSFEETYFKEIPLCRDLDKKFVWNIPKSVYEAHQYANERDDNVLDPLICIYALLTEDPLYTMGVYMKTMKDIIDNNESVIDKSCKEYYEALNEEEENDNE